MNGTCLQVTLVFAAFLAGCDWTDTGTGPTSVLPNQPPLPLVVGRERTRPTESLAAAAATDLLLPDVSAWSGDVVHLAEAARRLAGPNATFLRIVQAATTLVSRLGRAGDWQVGLTGGPLDCAVRAKLLATIVRDIDPDSYIRIAGMASVPRQGAHTALEIYVPAQHRWGFFDPSSGIFFTRDGALEGLVLSMAELFARPEFVGDPGPFAPSVQRRNTAPESFELGHQLETVVRLQPGFTGNNFPLRDMIEQAAAYGAYVPSEPIVNRIVIDMNGTHVFDGIVEKNGRIRSRLSAFRHKNRGPYVSWLHRLGISTGGLNVTPSYELKGLEAGRDYALRITMTRVSQGFAVRPLPVRGCRFIQRSMRQVLPFRRSGELLVYEIPLRATGTEAIVLLTHDGRKPGDEARIGRIELISL